MQTPRLSSARVLVLVVLAAAGVAAALIAISVTGSGSGSSSGTSAPAVYGGAQTSQLLSGIRQRGNVLGRADAPVTLVEYADIQCPYCAQWARDAFPAIVRDYVRPGKVKLVFNGLAFLDDNVQTRDSDTALQTVVAAGSQNRLWNVLDLLFLNQGEENSGWVTEDLLRAIGAEVSGLDVQKMLDDRGTEATQSGIAASEQAAAEAGINSTPSFQLGRTGGPLLRLQVSSLDAAAFRPPLNSLLGE